MCDVNLENSNLTHQFSVQLSSTRRGARLARLLGTEQIRSWGLPHEAAAQVIAELASNAATHGRSPGRDFRIVLTLPSPTTLRIEVTDTRPDRLPTTPRNAALDEEWGRGLVLVNALSTRWGAITGPPPCKTVWAELDLTPGTASDSYVERHP
ncbi:ATP-binding protein [Streptomyces liangshanensis]|uniref:ATP-binding protein n=1 Tax=Streptomyces liangshanensis TaxID=2717324 RepID=A0A6G9H8R0_9ACTN|nr:ATP-binding protein [Streptomyces liangshanensis]